MYSTLSKETARKNIAGEIAALPDDYVTDSDKGLFLRVISLKEFINARVIMIYHSIKREPGTLEIAKAALNAGKTVAFPYCCKGGIMQARTIHDLGELKPSMLGIPAPPDTAPVIAPEELELIITPALTYDVAGYRIGYGGGYYDRYLNGIPAFTAGLARERLLKQKLPREPHDIAVKCVVTENAVIDTMPATADHSPL